MQNRLTRRFAVWDIPHFEESYRNTVVQVQPFLRRDAVVIAAGNSGALYNHADITPLRRGVGDSGSAATGAGQLGAADAAARLLPVQAAVAAPAGPAACNLPTWRFAMPTSMDNEKDESPRRGSSRGSRPRAVPSSLSTETILDLVERFGLVDMVTSKVRERLEAVDLDDMFDELQKYVRRNPEVLVVALATITVSAGLIVYLNARNEEGGQDDADEEAPARVRAAAPRARR